MLRTAIFDRNVPKWQPKNSESS